MMSIGYENIFNSSATSVETAHSQPSPCECAGASSKLCGLLRDSDCDASSYTSYARSHASRGYIVGTWFVSKFSGSESCYFR